MTKQSVVVGDIGKAVASNIRQLRTAQGASTYDLSRRLAELGHVVSPSAIAKVERCERRVDVDDLGAFARVLNVTPIELLAPTLLCPRCEGEPPAGFKCPICGAES